MATNPSIHNTGGIQRFIDYVSQIPDFLKAEDDVVVLLQLLSDYLNNAYRNITVVEKFEFKFVSIESNLAKVQKKTADLVNLFKQCELRDSSMLFLSKPQGNPYIPSRPFIVEYIKYNGDLDSISEQDGVLSSEIISSAIRSGTNTLYNGDKFFVKFTKTEYSSNDGVYYYDSGSNTLVLDPYTSSQDPFTNTINEPITSVIGLVPRIITFNPSNISDIHTRKADTIDGLDYYTVYFTATITNVSSMSSVFTVERDMDNDGKKEKIVVDYYDMIKTLPSVYDDDISIRFGNGCDNFEWIYGYGKGIFYARELTNTNILTDKNMTSFIDPYYESNQTILTITEIVNLSGNVATVTTSTNHNVNIGDYVYISGTALFDKANVQVISTINSKQFTYKSTTIGQEYVGKIIISNLYYSKLIDSSKYKLKLNYTNKVGSDTITSGDLLYRINNEYDLVSANTYAETDMNVSTQTFTINSVNGFDVDSYVMATIPAGTTTPLTENTHYKIVSNTPISNNRSSIKLEGVSFSTVGINNPTNDPIVFNKINTICDESEFNITTQEFILNDVTGLKSGDYIKIHTLYGNTPTLLNTDTIYTIESVNAVTNGIKIHEIRYLTVSTSVVFGIVKLNVDTTTHGKIYSHNTQGSTGTIEFTGVYGDVISSGMFIKHNPFTYFPSVMTSTSITTPWNSSKIYYKNDYVYYNGMRYKVLKTHTSGTIDPRNTKYYIIDMVDIVNYEKKVAYNPYMNGMYSTKSLDYSEEPDYTIGFDELYSDLYITKTEDLSLKYGYEQRQFVFDPRVAPSTILQRNGFMEIIQGSHDYDAVTGAVSNYVKARTLDSMLLKGADWELNLTIDRISKENGLVTVATTQIHQLDTGVYVTVSNLNESVFNGRHKITVITPYAFTYEVDDLTTQSGTYSIQPIAMYNNDIRCGISSIIRVGIIATVNTTDKHGYSSGITVKIEGADQSQYNIDAEITVEDDYTFTYIVDGFAVTPATTTSEIITIYTPSVGDFISVDNQENTAQNGIYVISNVGEWNEIDTTKVSVPLTLFMQQNLFDTTTLNPATCMELSPHNIYSMVCDSNSIATVTLYDGHSYITGTVVTISGASQGAYNGKFEVLDTPTTKSFRYKLKGGSLPTTATPQSGLELLCQSEQWYKYSITDIEWQQKSSYDSSYIGHYISEISGNGSKITVNTSTNATFSAGDIITISNTESYNGTFTIHEVLNANTFVIIGATTVSELVGNVYKGISITPNSNKNNVNTLYGEYKFKFVDGTYYTFRNGDIIELKDQLLTRENGIYRVKSNALWTRLDKKLVMKIKDITIDARENDDYDELDDAPIPYVYVRYTDSEVDAYVTNNFAIDNQVYKVYGRYATNFNFQFEKIENLDTSSQIHQQYNSRYDYNSIAPRTGMSSDFIGVTDLKYPLAEKFERLAYLKDPKVIDIELIEYLARFMGYDISNVKDDINESIMYTTDEERNNALRETIQNLPQYYTLKGTESSLELLLATFGIVGQLVTYWTRAEDPYNELIPDYEIKGTQLTDNLEGKQSNFVVTPHFSLKVEIEGNFDNQLLGPDKRRITNQIRSFKPINTVFDGIFKFLYVKAKSTVTISNMRSVGKLSASVGFDPITFTEELTNGCFDGTSWNIQAIPYLISVDPTNIITEENTTHTIIPQFSDGGIYACAWTTSDPLIATVDQNGVVTVLNVNGTAIISCTYNSVTLDTIIEVGPSN